MINEIKILAETADSFYVYDRNRIISQAEKMKKSFPGIGFLYSVKCNPNRDILKTVMGREIGFGADAASPEEVRLAAEAGLSKEQIYYSAPGKTENELKEAFGRAVIIADSLTEISRISGVAQNAQAEIGLRINPDFSMGGGGGAASKFGIDEQDAMDYLQRKPHENIKVTGIHVHLKSQETDTEKLRVYYGNILRLAEKTEKLLGYPLSYINMGSGIGIAYSAQDREPDLERLGAETIALLSGYRNTHPDTKILIETGRFVVCQSGTYVTHVADKKTSHGVTYVVLQNTLNGFLRPSLARLVLKYAQEAEPAATEPLYTESNAFAIEAPYPERETECVTLVGNLCTAADVIAENISLPRLEPGDLVMISNAGAYARVLSPMQFSFHQVPKEFLI